MLNPICASKGGCVHSDSNMNVKKAIDMPWDILHLTDSTSYFFLRRSLGFLRP